ncbi:hypothetical protein M4914_05255, partial [Streptomyces somaliensis DSM 40738]|nr:hypothetical protein [Streptomyces somaliensis DSM 40738]
AISGPLGAIRVSFGAGTPDEHLDRFVRAVRELVGGGARRGHRAGDGHRAPTAAAPWPVPIHSFE